LLIATAGRALGSLPVGSSFVEVGSFCGRSTVVLASVVKAVGASSRVYAIDPHDGKVGAADQGLQSFLPTREIFERNMAEHALSSVVETIPKPSFEVVWEEPIALLFIDGLHDYENVSRDFHHFEKWIVPGGYAAFHDYAGYYPGVKRFVNELLAERPYEKVRLVNSMIVLRKIADEDPEVSMQPVVQKTSSVSHQLTTPTTASPLVSCIMPTANRRLFVPQSIRHFLRQDYANRELIIIDDGTDSIADLVPADKRIRYVRLNQRQTIGAKHNLACELAQGEIIVHWDDDDWMAHWRLSYQAQKLLRNSPSTLCGLSHLLFYDPHSNRAWKYVYQAGGRPWVSGATFCYFKSFWKQHRFPDMNEGGDTVFVWELKDANVVPLQDHTFYVATVHPANTSRKHTESHGWHPFPSHEIRCLLDDQSWQFYQDFSSSQKALP